MPAPLPWLHRCPRPLNLLQQNSKYLHSFLPGVMVSAQRKSASHAAHRQYMPLALNYRQACLAMTGVAHQLFPIFQRKESYTFCILLLTVGEPSFLIWILQAFFFFPFSLAISASSLLHLGESDPGNCSNLNFVLGEIIQHSHPIYAFTKQAKTKPIIFRQQNGFSSIWWESNTFPLFRLWRQSAALNKKGILFWK